MDVQSAFDELLVLLQDQGFTVEQLAGGRWRFERGRHHVIATVNDRDTLWLCVDGMLSGGAVTCTRQVSAFLRRWELYPPHGGVAGQGR